MWERERWRNKHESNVQEIGALTISNCLVLPMTIIPKGDSYQIWTDTYSLKASGTNHYTKEPFLFYFIILYSEIRNWTQSNRLWSYCATVTLLRFYLFIFIIIIIIILIFSKCGHFVYTKNTHICIVYTKCPPFPARSFLLMFYNNFTYLLTGF